LTQAALSGRLVMAGRGQDRQKMKWEDVNSDTSLTLLAQVLKPKWAENFDISAVAEPVGEMGAQM